MGFISEFIKVIFDKQYYYLLFDEELIEMELLIERIKLNPTKCKDEMALACLNVVHAIIMANSVLPAGFSGHKKIQVDKIFNIENAGIGSVPYLIWSLDCQLKTKAMKLNLILLLQTK